MLITTRSGHFQSMFVFGSILLIHFSLLSAYDKGSHNSDIQVESYNYGDYVFNFYYVAANWDEAFAICKASSARLAVVHNMDRANFLARTLSHTIVGVEDMWIGARFLADNWQWVAIRHLLPQETVDGFPPWLNYPTKRGKYCLSLDRTNHSKPLFVELQCFLQRPFICEKSSAAHLTVKPTLTTKIKVNTSTFSIYYGRVTWEQSLEFCKRTRSQLATVPNIEIANQLVTIMQHLRPAIRNAWIGGRKQSYGWLWISTEQELPKEKDLETAYPPWANDDYKNTKVFKDCLVLDHHVCKSNRLHMTNGIDKTCKEKSIFLGESCSLKKDFICEAVPEQKKSPSEELELVKAGSITYIYSKERQPWKSAAEVCNSVNMVLALPANKWELDAIVSNLADVEYAWDHIWLGAKWDIIENRWESVNNTVISTNSSYLPWCNSMPVHENLENCLNLDRDGHKIPVVYGFNCSIPQGFVCQLIPEEVSPAHSSHTYLINYFLLNHADAEEACQLHKSHLAITNSIEFAQNLSLLLPIDTPVWVGAERFDNQWLWTQTKEKIPDLPGNTSYPPWAMRTISEGKVCLAVQSGYRRYPQFIELPCNEQLFFACEISPESLPEPAIVITHNDNTYYFYQKRVTWDTADAYCMYSHLQLPKIGNLELANLLSEISGDAHPWWVGAKRNPNDSWYWTATQQKISNKSLYAQWFNASKSGNRADECLVLLDGTRTEKFAGRNCNEKQAFICANYKPIPEGHVYKKGNIEFEIHRNLANLHTSKKYCKDNEMFVMNITNNNELIKTIMHEEKLKSLWLDVIKTSTGKWIYEDTKEEFSSDIKFTMKPVLYEHMEEQNCAMLILKADGNLEIRKSDCNDFSFILCQKNNKTKDEQEAGIEDIEKTLDKNLKFTANVVGQTYVQAKSYCEDLGGDIIEERLYSDAVNFFKTLSPEFVSFWIDVKQRQLPHKKYLNLSKTSNVIENIQNKSKLCSAYCRLENVNCTVDCNEKLATVCFWELKQCKSLQNVTNLKWRPRNCQENEIPSGRVCTGMCLRGQLFGPEKIICIKGNWKYRSLTVNTSKCLSTKNQSEALLQFLMPHVIKKHNARIPFLFLIDNGSPQHLFQISISLVKHMVNVILLEQCRQTSVVMYSKNAKMALDFYIYDTCDFTEKLKFITTDEHSLPPNYYRSFENVNTLLKQKNFKQVFLVFFALRKDTGPTTERIEVIETLQNRGVVIIVLAVPNGMDRASLEGLASVHNGDLQLYLFKDEKALQECGIILQQHANPAIDKCIFEKQARP